MTDPDFLARTIVEGVLLKVGDVILMHSPGLLKKGTIVAVIFLGKKIRKNKKIGGKKSEQHPRSK